jgi:alkanesulfonate monooxygenase SsuD/methylene tetrahydromethanopterin reductase-like flavin-dependent oxidoreductase (luciferase family)
MAPGKTVTRWGAAGHQAAQSVWGLSNGAGSAGPTVPPSPGRLAPSSDGVTVTRRHHRGGSLEGFRHKSSILQGHCNDLGTDFGSITRSANYTVIIGETDNDVRDRLAWFRSQLVPHLPADRLDEYVNRIAGGPLVGTPGQLAERLTTVQDAGMTYAICYFPEAAFDASGYTLFAEQVIPAFRGA